MVVATVQGQPVRLRDVGRVEIGPETERKVVRFNGEAAVGLGVVKLSGANTIAVVGCRHRRDREAARRSCRPTSS